MEGENMDDEEMVIYNDEMEKLKSKLDECLIQMQLLRTENRELKLRLEQRNVIDGELEEKENSPPAKIARTSIVGNNMFVSNNKKNNEIISRKQSYNSNSSVNHDTAENIITDDWLQQKQKKKIKVFHAIDTNVMNVSQKLKKAECKNFVAKQSNLHAPVKILVNNEEEVVKVRNILKNCQTSFHEYKRKEEKFGCFLIKGLVGITKEELNEVKNELVEKGLPNDIELSLFVTGYMRANSDNKHNTLVKLVVPPNFDSKVLLKIKFLMHVGVRFEMRKSNNVLQCKNCQRFGHSYAGCQHAHRCVKCGANHLRDECPRTNNKTVKLKCCNCGGDHTANNLSKCVFFKETCDKSRVKGNQEKSKSDGVNSSGKSLNKFINSNVSFAEAIKNKKSIYRDSRDAVSAPTRNVLENSETGLSKVDAKLDVILKMVLKHEALLAKLIKNE